MADLWESADALNKDVIALTMIVSGLFICFFGAKFFKHIIFFVGFALGAIGAYFLVPEMLGLFNMSLEGETLLYVSLACGAGVGILLVIIYKAAVFTCGAFAGVLVAQLLWTSVIIPFELDEYIPEGYVGLAQVIFWVIFALIGGWLAFKFVEFLLKGITSFIGAFMFSSSVAYFVQRIDTSTEDSQDIMSWIQFFTTYDGSQDFTSVCQIYCYITLGLWVVLTFFGCYIQYRFHKRHKRKDYDDDMSDDSDDDSDEEEESRRRQRRADKRRSQKKKKKRKGGTVRRAEQVNSHSADMDGRYQRSFDGAQYQGRGHQPSYYTRDPHYGDNGYGRRYEEGTGPQYNIDYRGGATNYA